MLSLFLSTSKSYSLETTWWMKIICPDSSHWETLHTNCLSTTCFKWSSWEISMMSTVELTQNIDGCGTYISCHILTSSTIMVSQMLLRKNLHSLVWFGFHSISSWPSTLLFISCSIILNSNSWKVNILIQMKSHQKAKERTPQLQTCHHSFQMKIVNRKPSKKSSERSSWVLERRLKFNLILSI